MRLSIVIATLCAGATSAVAEPADHCRKVGNDDTVRPYESVLKSGFASAYRRLFPQGSAPDAAMLQAEGSYRCMGGRLYACFTGANLPCSKIDMSRTNTGAAAFCRTDPNADVVPMVATGHDTAYAYRCRGGKAEVTSQVVKTDARGFGKDLWAPMN